MNEERSRWFWPALAVGWALIAVGIVGMFSQRDRTTPFQLVRYVIGFLLVHDVVVAPVVIGVGWLVTRFVPAVARGPLRAALALSALVVAFSWPLLRRYGEHATNDSALPARLRPHRAGRAGGGVAGGARRAGRRGSSAPGAAELAADPLDRRGEAAARHGAGDGDGIGPRVDVAQLGQQLHAEAEIAQPAVLLGAGGRRAHRDADEHVGRRPLQPDGPVAPVGRPAP